MSWMGINSRKLLPLYNKKYIWKIAPIYIGYYTSVNLLPYTTLIVCIQCCCSLFCCDNIISSWLIYAVYPFTFFITIEIITWLLLCRRSYPKIYGYSRTVPNLNKEPQSAKKKICINPGKVVLGRHLFRTRNVHFLRYDILINSNILSWNWHPYDNLSIQIRAFTDIITKKPNVR